MKNISFILLNKTKQTFQPTQYLAMVPPGLPQRDSLLFTWATTHPGKRNIIFFKDSGIQVDTDTQGHEAYLEWET